MQPTEAREHLDLVERIIAGNERGLCVVGDFFLVWGIVGALLDGLAQLVVDARLGPQWLWLAVVFLAFGIVYSIVRARALRRRTDRMSVLQHEYLNIIWLSIGITVVAQIGGYAIFSQWASAALWTLSATIVSLYVGLHGNRAGVIGGVILMVSLVCANFMHDVAGFVLAAGMLFGYAGFGLIAMLSRD